MTRQDLTIVAYSIEGERREATFQSEADAVLFFDILTPKFEQGVCDFATVFERITRRALYRVYK